MGNLNLFSRQNMGGETTINHHEIVDVCLGKVVEINDIRLPNDLMDGNVIGKVDATKQQKRTSCILRRGAKDIAGYDIKTLT